jgi:lipopolysaccharide exporter
MTAEPGPVTAEPIPGRSLRHTVIRSTSVNFVVSVVLKVGLLAQAVLYARLFAPADLGQFSTALLVISFALLLSQMGLHESIVRESRSPERIMNTAFTLSIVTGLVLFLLLVLVAPLLASMFRTEAAAGHIRLLAVLVFTVSLGLPNLMWIRRFSFGIAKVAAFVDLVVSTAATLFLHLVWGWGVWSLLAGRACGFVAQIAVVWTLAPYRPRLAWDSSDARALTAFGWPVLMSGIANYFINQGDDLLVRYHFGAASLAIYGLAFALPFYLREFTDVLLGSLLPTYAHFQESRERSAAAFLQADRYLTAAMIPLSFSLFVFAEPLTVHVFGAKWADAVPVLRIFALAFTVELMGGYSWGILALARGKTKYLLYVKLWIVSYLVLVGAYLIGRFGMMGGAYYNLTQTLITVFLVRSWVLRRELGTLSFFGNSLRPLAAALAAGAIFVLGPLRTIPSLGTLVAATLGYLVLYAAVLALLDRRLIAEARDMARVLLRPRAAA